MTWRDFTLWRSAYLVCCRKPGLPLPLPCPGFAIDNILVYVFFDLEYYIAVHRMFIRILRILSIFNGYAPQHPASIPARFARGRCR
jgi:hypothetical protein